MEEADDKKKYLLNPEDTEDESGSTGGQTDQGGSSGGQKGEIAFRYKDAMSLPPRDDMMSPEEIRRIIIVHKDIHKDRVEKQKLTRQERAALKSGKRHHLADNKRALGQGFNNSKFKKHPISNKAQFSGMDKQTSTLPTEFDAETNNELREKLENRLTNRNTPRFNPKPRPYH